MPTKIRQPCYHRVSEGQLAKQHFPVVSGIVKDGMSHKLSPNFSTKKIKRLSFRGITAIASSS